jgi:DHA2 family multidrug resistance protein
MLAMMPLNQASMAAVSREESADAAGLYNMARNMGGSVGLAIIGVVIDRRNSFHVEAIRESVTANSLRGQERIAADAAGWLARTSDAAHANLQALGQLARQIQVQAAVMTYSETFYVLAIALLVCVPLALLLRVPRQTSPTAGSAGH